MRDAANANVASYVEAVRVLSYFVSHCALTAVKPSPFREPGHSISEIDERLGSESDVEGPLLTAHRLAKFYLISSGDCVYSMSLLLQTAHPNFIGSAALARSAAEHSSRSMFVSAPDISYQARLIRTYLLINSSLNQYKSTHDVGATNLIGAWNRWRVRTGSEFKGVPKQSLGNPTALLEKCFPGIGTSSYEELSRPTHGNATWVVVTAIQEQKQTAVARIMLMRNAMFAICCVMTATKSAASLWGLDLDLVVRTVATGDRSGMLKLWEEKTWDDLVACIHDLSEVVASFDERQFVDASTDPQPWR
ncbi:hypothetical protein [Mycobacteroides salmoniphilum]|uniref:Uncharacterized protein n=1 Tax=Mycobacteroides salmoniphilum TaxID=404941 RepID=A0A4R8SEM1_9MYCO|nr:hypothetical protein [Mycobacteroides salmoniphilum]TDZ95247.1 hypothetical protein CCUG60885_01378 [Mycobacteroides salmoniphilum]TEA04343.1 hypothetical protein CCUG60883_01636 [Mycobacteroides salmoniphilum]